MWRSLVVLVLCAVVCGGSRVLVVSPVPSRGHTVLIDSVVKILLGAGHEVTYISPNSKLKNAARLTRVNASHVGDDGADRSSLTISELVHSPWPPQRILALGVELADRLLQHEAVQELLSDTSDGYDAVIVDWYFSGLLAPLAAVYDCPLIWFSALDASWLSLQLIHEQTSPAYALDSLANGVPTQPYDITSRLYRLWRQVYLTGWVHYTTYYKDAPAYEQIYHPYYKLRNRPLPPYESLVYNGSLLLVNSNPLVGQSLPLPANVKYVGGHHIVDPVKPLPKILQEILDSAKHGAIYFNLGSQVDSSRLPQRVKKELLQMFSELEQIVIWRTNEKFDHLPGNVFTWSWVPQTCILNHWNTMMFINQGGLTSLIEAVYYGVPVIGIPLVEDQFVNIDIARLRGRGIKVDYSNNLAFDLRRAINEVLGNYSYRGNVKQAAEVFRNSAVSPKQELLHNIELVITTKGAHHLRSPALQLSTVQALYLDAVVLLLLFLWFLSKVVKVIKVHTEIYEDEDKKDK